MTTFKNLNGEVVATDSPVALARLSWTGSPRHTATVDGVEHLVSEGVWRQLCEEHQNDSRPDPRKSILARFATDKSAEQYAFIYALMDITNCRKNQGVGWLHRLVRATPAELRKAAESSKVVKPKVSAVDSEDAKAFQERYS